MGTVIDFGSSTRGRMMSSLGYVVYGSVGHYICTSTIEKFVLLNCARVCSLRGDGLLLYRA